MKRWFWRGLLACLLCASLSAAAQIDPDKPAVALTFDDGPSEYTQQVLDLLAEHGCHATFFMVGKRMEQLPEQVAAVAQSGSEVALHTWSHDDLSQCDRARIQRSLENNQALAEELSGGAVTLVRPPWGKMSNDAYGVCHQLGLYAVIWSIDSEDWKTRDAEKTCQNIMSQLTNGGIILCHDTYPETVEAVRQFLPMLEEEGYQAVSVGELFSLSSEPMQTKKLYHSLPPERMR